MAGFDGRFHRLNPSWEATLGYSVDELTSRPFLDFVHPDDRALTVTAFEALVAGQDVLSFENRYVAHDGAIHWLQWNARAARAEGLIQAVARDVTDIRRAADELARATKEAERANRAKSEFLSRMSHELRTPMTQRGVPRSHGGPATCVFRGVKRPLRSLIKRPLAEWEPINGPLAEWSCSGGLYRQCVWFSGA